MVSYIVMDVSQNVVRLWRMLDYVGSDVRSRVCRVHLQCIYVCILYIYLVNTRAPKVCTWSGV